MIEQSLGEIIPFGASTIKRIGDRVFIYFPDDPEEIEFALKSAKAIQCGAILKMYELSIIRPFMSGGDEYSTDLEDIQDMTNAVSIGAPVEFRTRGGNFRLYTAGQIRQVLGDYHANKVALIKKRDRLIQDIQDTTTEAEAWAITWGDFGV